MRWGTSVSSRLPSPGLWGFGDPRQRDPPSLRTGWGAEPQGHPQRRWGITGTHVKPRGGERGAGGTPTVLPGVLSGSWWGLRDSSGCHLPLQHPGDRHAVAHPRPHRPIAHTPLRGKG